MNTWEELVETLFESIWPDKQAGQVEPLYAQGLLAVFGATASGKNKVARGLVHCYLSDPRVFEYYDKVKQRRPHLVTFEDPIEEWFWEKPQELPYPYQKDCLDYSPRQKDDTAESLRITLESALRQTPAAVYIGETREPRDWQHILGFAGTGHFVTTTAHAGSLTEAVGVLLNAVKAATPGARRDVADRLVAVVHLRQHKVKARFRGILKEMTITLPAVWLGGHSGRHNLMALGRGSMLPSSEYCLGRRHFAERLISKAQSTKSRDKDTAVVEDAEFLAEVLRMDLEGV